MKLKSVEYQARSRTSIRDLSGIVGGAIGVAASVVTILDGLECPAYRWLLWLAATLLLTVAAYKSKAGDNPVGLTSGDEGFHKVFKISAGVFGVILAVDFVFSLLRSPIARSDFVFVGMTRHGYTSNATDNPLILNNVETVVPITADRDADAPPFFGLCIQFMFRKTKAIEELQLHDFVVEVERFEPMPPFASFKAAPEQVSGIESRNKLRVLESKIPWHFPSERVQLDGASVQLPLIMSDSDPAKITFWLTASDPGIYWMRFYAVVSDGFGPRRRAYLSPKIIPVGFYGELPKPVRLEEVRNSDEWIAFPLDSSGS